LSVLWIIGINRAVGIIIKIVTGSMCFFWGGWLS